MKKKSSSDGSKFHKASLDPADQTSGGFMDDVGGTVMSAKTTWFDYQGKRPKVPALLVKVHVDGTDKIRDEYLSAGKAAKTRPSKDGKTFLTTGKGIPSGSKAGLFLASLQTAGWPKGKWKLVSDDANVIAGLHAQFAQVPMPRINDDDEDATKKAPQATTISEIHKLPWENKGFRKKVEAQLAEADESEDEDGGEGDDEEEEDADGEESSDDDTEDADEDSDSDEDGDDADEEESDDSDEAEDGDEEESDDAEEEESDDSDDEDEGKSKASSSVVKETTAAISALLKDKKYAKGVSVDDLAQLVFVKVKASKNKRKCVELAQDEAFLKKAFKVVKGKVLKK